YSIILTDMKAFFNFVAAEFPKTPSPKPARIPPQTPPAGGTGAEAGRIHIPSQMFRPAESALVFRVLRKMGSDFFKQTPPFQICRRSCLGASPLGCLGASPLGIGFRQEIPGGFEFRQKNSRQKSAVPKRSLDCAFSARADEERFLEIVGVSAMPLSI
ncbi:MAG: hypothetical protein HW401_855, partial [Parcubacteria group bacterium]|nr:hypothetical protein [Parcubacteria group bacterium]